MGGGNVCKANAARAKAAAKAAAAGKATTNEDRKKHEASRNAVQCTICMTGFSRTVKQPELQQHFDNKHSKSGKTFAEAFPGFTEDGDDDDE